MIYYSEFLATRKNVDIGWDIEELPGTHKFQPDGKIRTRILRIMNRFEYYDYQIAGYFLFYDDYLKRFLCARASKGDVIDRRTNMTITMRVPDITEGDGYVECMRLLQEWEQLEGEFFNIKEICKKYDIDKKWLEGYTKVIYKQAFSQEAEPVQLVSRSFTRNSEEEAQFAFDMMMLSYELIPTSKKFRLSFGFRIPADKARGMRILINQEAHLSKCFDVTIKNTIFPRWEAGEKYGSMISKIVEEALATDGSYDFPDQIDQRYIQVADFGSMYWNYCYYELEKNKEFPCTFQEYQMLREEVKKQMQNKFLKAELLFEGMIFYLYKKGTSPQETMVLLNDCMELYSKKKNCNDEQLTMMWSLLGQCAEGDAEKMNSLLVVIRKNVPVLYYQLIRKGLQENYVDMQYVITTEKLSTREDIENWMKQPYSSELLRERKVLQMLMQILQPFFQQSASLDEIKKLITLGNKIDKSACLYILESYMEEGIDNATQNGRMTDYLQYLRHTEVLWRGVSVIQGKVESAYLRLAYQQESPMQLKEVRAFTEIKWKFSEVQEVQKILLQKCRRELLFKPEGDLQLEQCLDLLIRWNTGISAVDYDLMEAKNLLQKLTGMHANENLKSSSLKDLLSYEEVGEHKGQAYVVWLEILNKKLEGDIPVEEILDQLDKKRLYLEDEASEHVLMSVFQKLFEQSQKKQNVKQMMQIVACADSYLNRTAMIVWMEMFWKGVSFYQFEKISKINRTIWNKKTESPLSYELEDRIEQELFDIYQRIYSSASIDAITSQVHSCLSGPERKRTEDFLTMLLLGWQESQGEIFERILDVLMVCWETDEDLYDKIRDTIEDTKEASQLIRRIKLGGYFELKTIQMIPEDGDAFWGTVIGGAAALLSILWNIMLAGGGGWPSALFMLIQIVIFVVLSILGKQYMKKERTFSVTALAVAGVIWGLFNGIYGITKGNVWISMGLLVILFGAQGIYWFLSMKRKGK